jgi:hypothetical protein
MDDDLVWLFEEDGPPPIARGIDADTLVEPEADVHALFIHFNELYFESKLHAVEVKWSDRMTLFVFDQSRAC